MTAMLKFEWYRLTHSVLFWITVSVSCLLSIVASMEQLSVYLQGIDHISVFCRWIGQMNMRFGSHYLFIIIPLLASFAYSFSGCSDRKQGYIYQIITRSERKKYFWSKYIISFISGGIVFASAVLLNLLILALFMPAEIPDPVDMTSVIDQFRFCSVLYYTKPFLFAFLWLIVVFLWGGVMSCMGLLAGMFTENLIIAVSIPFMIFIGEGVLGGYIMHKEIFKMGNFSLELIWEDMLYSGTPGAAPTDYIFSMICMLIAVTLICYWIRVKKYECL